MIFLKDRTFLLKFVHLHYLCAFITKNITEKMNNKKKAALSSIFAGFFLTSLKFAIGIMTSSLGILSEALHSLLDLVAAAITYISVSISDKPADKNHNYGHGKVENLSAFMESILLVVASFWIVYEAVSRLVSGHQNVEITIWSYVVVIVSMVVDFSRSRNLSKVAKTSNSQALEADAIHFSTDILSSGCVLLGLVLANFGFFVADAIAAICVSFIILYIAYGMCKKAIDVLLDKVPEGLTELVEAQLKSNPNIQRFHNLRIRTAGANTFIEVNVHFLPELNLHDTHILCDEIENGIRQVVPKCEITVHEEPNE
jgi:cation diffusion facilitator family transporter